MYNLKIYDKDDNCIGSSAVVSMTVAIDLMCNHMANNKVYYIDLEMPTSKTVFSIFRQTHSLFSTDFEWILSSQDKKVSNFIKGEIIKRNMLMTKTTFA
jgi:hypothetical protein